MQVRVLFFGVLKDLAGKASDSISLPENATLGDVLSHYEEVIPHLKGTAASLAMSVNQEYAGPATRLRSGDEVALLPQVCCGLEPVKFSGGLSEHAAIDLEAIAHDS